MERRQRVAVVCATALVCLVASRKAEATATCASLNLPNPIYVVGSSAVKTYVEYMGAALASATTPSTVLYVSPGSCVGVTALFDDPAPLSACTTGTCATGTATYFTSTGSPPVFTSNTCTLDTNGDHVDVAVSDVFGETCDYNGNAAVPTGFVEISGPVEAMTFVVPGGTMSTPATQALLAEEGYFVFGFPQGGGVTPWANTDADKNIFIRNALGTNISAASGTQVLTATAVGVPPAKMQGTAASGGSAGVLADVIAASPSSEGLGILGCDYYDANARATLTELAFQTFGQNYAYYADSQPNLFDKQNVRDGHYLPWGYAHFMARSSTANVSGVSGNAATIMSLVNGTTTLAGFSPVDSAIAAHFVPQCAMTVAKAAEGNYETVYSDPAPCDCYYVAKSSPETPLPASCTTCTSSTTCGTGTCRLGYCEPR